MADEAAAASDENDERVLREMIGRFDAPSYLRRARRVEATLETLLSRLRARRREELAIVGLRLAQLLALAGGWEAVAAWVAGDGLAALQALHAELQPRLRLPLEPTASQRALRSAVGELREAIELFNGRWEKELARVDVGPVNAAREAYNRYYVLERECAVGASRHNRDTFRPVAPLTLAELRVLVPPVQIELLA